MLGLILDTVILMVLIRLVTGDQNDGWVKPATIAILAAVALIAASIGAARAPESALLIVIGAIFGVGAFVTAGCWLLMSIELPKSLLIGVGFIVFKIAFTVLLGLAFG